MTVDELSNLCKEEFPTLIEAVEIVNPRRKRIRLTLFNLRLICFRRSRITALHNISKWSREKWIVF